jgi:hypothetical protein
MTHETELLKKLIEKLKGLILNYKILHKTFDMGVINTCSIKIEKLESEIAALEKEIESEKDNGDIVKFYEEIIPKSE